MSYSGSAPRECLLDVSRLRLEVYRLGVRDGLSNPSGRLRNYRRVGVICCGKGRIHTSSPLKVMEGLVM